MAAMTKEEIARMDDLGMSAWDEHDPEKFLGLFADDFTWIDDSVPDPMRTREEIRQYMQGWFTAFPDMHVRTTNRVIDEDGVGAEVEFSGTNSGALNFGGREIPATGKSVLGHGTYFARLRDGKIVEFHSHPDNAGMMMQLGLIPA